MKPALRTSTASLISELASAGPAEYEADTGFIENWQTAIGQMIDSNMSISKYVNHESEFVSRNFRLDRLITEGAIPTEEIPLHRDHYGLESIDYGALADVAKKYGHTEFNNQELDTNVREDIKQRAAYSQDIFRRSNLSGRIGQFAGAMHAGALDPIMLPSYFIGIGAAAKGASVLTKIGRAGLYGGLTEGGAQAVAEPFIYKWKHELQMEYGVKDSLENIMMAASLGALIPMTGVSIGAFGRKLATYLRDPELVAKLKGNPAGEEAYRLLDHTLREAEEGVKRYTPFKSAEESARVFEEAFSRPEYDLKSPQGRELLRQYLTDEQAKSIRMFDMEEGTEGGAIEYWAGIEGKVREIEQSRPSSSLREISPVDDKEIDTAFKAAIGDAIEPQATTPKTTEEMALPLATADAVDVVAKLDKEVSLLEELTNCLSGTAAI
jgi:hypothetical protein